MAFAALFTWFLIGYGIWLVLKAGWQWSQEMKDKLERQEGQEQ